VLDTDRMRAYNCAHGEVRAFRCGPRAAYSLDPANAGRIGSERRLALAGRRALHLVQVTRVTRGAPVEIGAVAKMNVDEGIARRTSKPRTAFNARDESIVVVSG